MVTSSIYSSFYPSVCPSPINLSRVGLTSTSMLCSCSVWPQGGSVHTLFSRGLAPLSLSLSLSLHPHYRLIFSIYELYNKAWREGKWPWFTLLKSATIINTVWINNRHIGDGGGGSEGGGENRAVLRCHATEPITHRLGRALTGFCVDGRDAWRAICFVMHTQK